MIAQRSDSNKLTRWIDDMTTQQTLGPAAPLVTFIVIVRRALRHRKEKKA